MSNERFFKKPIYRPNCKNIPSEISKQEVYVFFRYEGVRSKETGKTIYSISDQEPLILKRSLDRIILSFISHSDKSVSIESGLVKADTIEKAKEIVANWIG